MFPVRLPSPALVVSALLAMSCALPPLSAEEPPKPAFAPQDVEFFEASVRPLLVAQCQECHGAKKQEAKLRLDSREAVLAGSENGPVVVPGEPEKSLLITALHYND